MKRRGPFIILGDQAFRIDGISSIVRFRDGLDWLVVVDSQVRWVKARQGEALAIYLGIKFEDDGEGVSTVSTPEAP